jgi:hypothetical protein
MKRLLCFTAAFLGVIVSPARGEEAVSVKLVPDRAEVSVADSFRLTVSIEGARKSDDDPVLRGMEDFSVTPAGRSSRVKIVNGEMSAGIDYNYVARPRKKGEHRIGPAEVAVDGQSYRSGTVKLTVVEDAASAGENGEAPIFLRASLARDRVYAGERTLYTLRLHHRLRVSDIDLDLPQSGDVSFQQFGNPREYRGTYEGRAYDILEVRYMVQPRKAGLYALRPAVMDMVVYQPHERSRRDFFGSRFSSSGRPFRAAGEALELTVLDPPAEGRPSDYSGLVGSFTVRSSLDPPVVAAGESATLTVTVSGRGNVKRIPDLELPPVEGIKVYADEPKLEVGLGEEGVRGTKTMKWALVPQGEGKYEIPVPGLSFFDSEAERYRPARPEVLTLEATAGGAVDQPVKPAGEGPETAPAAVEEVGRDILPVHTSVQGLSSPLPGLPSPAALSLLLAAPPALFAVLLAGAGLRRKSAGSLDARRSRRAAARFSRRCRGGKGVPDDLIAAFQEYLNDRFGLSLGALTPGEAEEALLARGARGSTAREAAETVRDLQHAVYTGRGAEPFPGREGFLRLVARIEREVK